MEVFASRRGVRQAGGLRVPGTREVPLRHSVASQPSANAPYRSSADSPGGTTAEVFGRQVLEFYNGRGTAEQWIKEGKYALHWTRLSCHRFVANQVRLALFVLAYNLGNFLRRLALPASIRHWSLRSIQVKLIKIGAKVVHHARQVIFQMAEVAVSKELFEQILERIWALAPGAG